LDSNFLNSLCRQMFTGKEFAKEWELTNHALKLRNVHDLTPSPISGKKIFTSFQDPLGAWAKLRVIVCEKPHKLTMY
jgi:hypothetical protein